MGRPIALSALSRLNVSPMGASVSSSAPPSTADERLRADRSLRGSRCAGPPLVITWLRQLEQLGLTTFASDAKDRRRTLVSLSPEGRAEVGRVRDALKVMDAASSDLLDEAGPGVFEGLWRMASACKAKPPIQRLAPGSAISDTATQEAGPLRGRPLAWLPCSLIRSRTAPAPAPDQRQHCAS